MGAPSYESNKTSDTGRVPVLTAAAVVVVAAAAVVVAAFREGRSAVEAQLGGSVL